MAITLDGTNVTYSSGLSQNQRTPYVFDSGTPGSLTGFSSIGFPSGVRRIVINMWNCGLSGTDTLWLRARNSGGQYTGTSHNSFCAECSTGAFTGALSSANSLMPITMSGNAGYIWGGQIEIFDISTTALNVKWQLGSASGTYRLSWGAGTIAGVGEIYGISVATSGTNTFITNSRYNVIVSP